MGLDTTHDAWHGAYSAFDRWRKELARVAGLPPLDLMEGFFTKGDYRDPLTEWAAKFPNSANVIYDCLPIRWSALRPDPLHKLLYHSDCEGHLTAKTCGQLAKRLRQLLPLLPDGDGGGHIGNWREKTKQFISGLELAHKNKEKLEFH